MLDHVYGFAPANDVGLHDFRHADRGSMLRVKGQDGFLPIGPAVVTKDEWTPDDGFRLRTYLNGEVVQEGDERRHHLGLPLPARRPLAARSPSSRATSSSTGTPANSRPMEPGDVVEVEIEGLPRLAEHRRRAGRRPVGPGDRPEISPNTLHVALAIAEDEAEREVARMKEEAR